MNKKTNKKKKKFSQNFLGKTKFRIRKIKEKSLFWGKIRYAIYGMILFFFGVVFFNLQPNSNNDIQIATKIEQEEKKYIELAYFFHDQEGNTHSIFGNYGEHGAPQSWEYLFEGVEITTGDSESVSTIDPIETETPTTGNIQANTGDQQINTGVQNIEQPMTDILSGKNETIAGTWDLKDIEENDPTETNNNIGNEEQSNVSSGDITTTGNVLEENKNNEELPIGKKIPYIEIKAEVPPLSGNIIVAETLGIHLIPAYQRCDTPRGYQIVHGQSVLAYEQDLNTPNTCNIERRFCFDGKLSGTFRLQSCVENTKYSYYQEQFVSYTTPPKSDLIQPTPTPWNTAEELSQGNVREGIDEFLNRPNQGGSSRGDNGDAISPSPIEVEQTRRPYPDCKAPWWETVKHGQFVKAYRHKNGFNDAPCQVQLRTCVVGTLEGDYKHLSCRHWDTSYIDWLNNSPTWETYSKEKLQWIKDIRETEIYYQTEEGNSLNSEALDKILAILDL